MYLYNYECGKTKEDFASSRSSPRLYKCFSSESEVTHLIPPPKGTFHIVEVI